MNYETALDYYNNRTGTLQERADVVEALHAAVAEMAADHPRRESTISAANNLVTQTNGLQADLLDYIKTRAELKNDAALCRYLDLHPPQVSRLRSNEIYIGDRILLRIHEVSGIPIKEIKSRLCLPMCKAIRWGAV